jgi:hypothetical protein
MDISIIIHYLALFFVFGLCNIVFIILLKVKKLNKIQIVLGAIIWNFIMSFWIFEIVPGSENYFAEKRMEKLTGLKANVTKTYVYDEFGGFQGDGYTLYYYEFEKLNNIDTLALEKFPIQEDNKWKKSPISSDDLFLLKQHLETNTYKNKDSLKLQSIYSYIRKASTERGNFYSISEIKNRGIEIGFFSNDDQKFLYLNSIW